MWTFTPTFGKALTLDKSAAIGMLVKSGVCEISRDAIDLLDRKEAAFIPLTKNGPSGTLAPLGSKLINLEVGNEIGQSSKAG